MGQKNIIEKGAGMAVAALLIYAMVALALHERDQSKESTVRTYVSSMPQTAADVQPVRAAGGTILGNDSRSYSGQVAAETPINIDAFSLKKAYDDNEVRADDVYKHKLLRVTGTIVSIGKDILDHPYVVVSDDRNDHLGVQCVFENGAEVSALNKGQTVSVTGKCLGKMMNVQLDKCHL